MAEKDLMTKFKETIGDLSDNNSLREFYQAHLDAAYSDLISEDISEEVLQTPIGHNTQILYAQALMNGKDVTTNPTISHLKTKLSSMTKGYRHSEVKHD